MLPFRRKAGAQMTNYSKFWFTIVIAVFGSNSAYASDWRFIASGTDGMIVFADVESAKELPAVPIRRPFPIRQIWVKMDFSKVKTVSYREQRQLMRFNCEAETGMVASNVTYAANGRVLQSWSEEDYDFKFDPETPDTVGYNIMEFACGRTSLTPL